MRAGDELALDAADLEAAVLPGPNVDRVREVAAEVAALAGIAAAQQDRGGAVVQGLRGQASARAALSWWR